MTQKVPAIKVEGLCKSFTNKQQTLNNINLTVNQGDFTALIGVNGAGKTTLIKCLLDFCTVTAGNIEIFGKPHTNKAAREKLTFLPEIFLPPYYLTGLNFLAYIAELHSVEYDLEKIKKFVDILDLDIVELAKPVKAFSKGMAQKLGLVACFMIDKDLMIFDEPWSGLDPKARNHFKKYILQLRQARKTAFFSSHLLTDVDSLCDRIVILHAGQIKFNGTIAECKQTFHADNLEQAYLTCIAS